MNQYEQTKRELRLFFAAYGDTIATIKKANASSGYGEAYSSGLKILGKRDQTAREAIEQMVRTWQRSDAVTIEIDAYERGALAMVDVFEALGMR